MAATKTRKDDGKSMATDDSGADEPNERGRPQPQRPADTGGGPGGFFSIYKSGQGYWTRLCTGVAAGVLIAFTAHFLYTQLALFPAFHDAGRPKTGLLLGIVGSFVVISSGLAWWLLNKPTNADFLIATDSEMKKVNWTSRKDLIGSTKVVIGFMFLIAFFLFFVDVFFGYVFYFIGVLQNKPF